MFNQGSWTLLISLRFIVESVKNVLTAPTLCFCQILHSMDTQKKLRFDVDMSEVYSFQYI